MNARSTLAVFSLLLSIPTARAAQRGDYALFDIAPNTVSKEAQEAIQAVEQKCTVSMMSRIGPSPAQRAACDKAVVAALGKPDIAYAALQRLDREHSKMTVGWRMYDVIVRAGDLSVLEKLVVALERIDQHGDNTDRGNDKNQIAAALKRLTYADPKGSPHLAWREWKTAHPNVTRAQLLASKVTEMKQVLASAGHTDDHVDAITFLVQEPTTRDESRGTLDMLITQKGWSPPQHDRLASLQRSFKPAKKVLPFDDDEELPTAQLKKPRS